MIPNCLQLKNLGDKLSKLCLLGESRLADNNLSAICVAKVCDGAKHHIISQLPLRRVVVTADSLGAKSLVAKLKKFPDVNVCYLPERDDVLIPRKSFSLPSVRARITALSDIAGGKIDIVVMSADALLQLYPKRESVEKYTLSFAVEDIISPQTAADNLVKCGYTRQDMIGDIGDFALRGDILDVFSITGQAVRINFFDELVESVKTIDPETMLQLNTLKSISFPPAGDIILDEKTCVNATSKLAKHTENKYAAELLPVLHEGVLDATAIWGLPFFEGSTSSIFDYFDDEKPTVFIFDEPKVVFEKLQILEKEFGGRLKTLLAGGEILDEHKFAELPIFEIRRQILTRRLMSFSSLNLSNPLFDPKLIIEPKTRAVTKYYLDPESIYSDLRTYRINNFKVIIAAGSPERARGIMQSLYENDVFAVASQDGHEDETVLVTPLAIENGFVYPDLKVALIGVSECVGKHRGQDTISQKTQFIAPKAGDYVVHRVHGVGFCEGTTIMKTGEFEKEYVVLKYRDGDILYVASDQTDNLQKFVGEENPRLNKIGGREFEHEKEKVKKSVRALAINLLDLYSKRQKQRGFKYSTDTVWQNEFEDAFEYEETDDQLKAIEALKTDMESGRIMDRLVVGDVGFGKTEVAFRAMFKTVLDAKQAVLLAPTTILARQHYENLIKRLEPFGIRCGLLSRLQSAAENRETIASLASGTMHMVVATHKVLSKDVSFHDLGLLVLDEEQRFGVEHKEKLKERYPLVNVLTLSATPIPRTLNMALSGVRDISMLETAPQGRLPVQTYVVGYSDSLVVDAIQRETARGGQTLILLNDILHLDGYANRLRRQLDPSIRLITAHGQMAGGELEDRIEAFYENKYDVLIATTIIENGIDLPDANTLVVINADHFGLSQLYQLRGRVGRRGALAHAYFTLPENGALSTTAEKRLRALLDNTELGSGFKIALSDLSIRGAGSLLGAEQSGHIERVGYEMYLELLDEAVEELKTGKKPTEQRDVDIKIDAAAFIRDGYVSGKDKIRVYKQISSVSSFAGRDNLLKELGEVYGAVELPLENLINISLLKNLAKGCDVARVIINKNGAAVNFFDADVFRNESVMRAVANNASSVVLTNTLPPSLIFDVDKKTAEQKLARLLEFFGAVA